MSLLDVLLRLLAAGLALLPVPPQPAPADPPREERAVDGADATTKDVPVTAPIEDIIER